MLSEVVYDQKHDAEGSFSQWVVVATRIAMAQWRLKIYILKNGIVKSETIGPYKGVE